MKKYFIVRITANGERQYRKNKTIDGIWIPEHLKGYCWRFSQQGAKKIINQYGSDPKYTYSVELVNDDELSAIDLLNILSRYKRMITRNKDYPTVLIDDLEKSINFVLNKYQHYPHN